jgi:adenosylhomocysteine nucleosidase
MAARRIGLFWCGIVLCLVFSLSSSLCLAQKIALIGALDEEIEGLKKEMKNLKLFSSGGIFFYEGNIGSTPVVLFKSGVGKVNAAYSLTVALSRFDLEAVVFTGVAGGTHPDTQPGDIVLGTEVFYHDYVWHLDKGPEIRATRNLISAGTNPLRFKTDSLFLMAAKMATKNLNFEKIEGRSPQVFEGPIGTGDAFINNAQKAKELYALGAYATEMEGAAIAHIAHMRALPFFLIRSISDNANQAAHVDFMKFVKPAAANASQIIIKTLELWSR